MSQHYITELQIHKVRHLKDIDIKLSNAKRTHLLLTGRNGAGKTSVLEEIRVFFKTLEKEQWNERCSKWKQSMEDNRKLLLHDNRPEKRNDWEKGIKIYERLLAENAGGIDLIVKNAIDIQKLYNSGEFIVAYYPAHRMSNLDIPSGTEKIDLANKYDIEQGPSHLFIKYLVDLKTQQSFARNEGDMEVVENIKAWFQRLEHVFQIILDDGNVSLEFDYRNYSMQIKQKNRCFGMNELSDGFSSVLNILSDLILRMDRKRGINERNYAFNIEGIVLIDELETHLHVELQKKIFPFLTEFFPNIQFIVTTHSPFILNSVENVVVYDLENKIRIENMSEYSYEGVIEGYFDVDQYSEKIKKKLEEYRKLVNKVNCTKEERARRAELRLELSEISMDVAKDAKAEFEMLEKQRKMKNGKDR